MLSFGIVNMYNITIADMTLKRSIEGLKTTNFRRLPRTRKAQSARSFFMKSKFKVRLLHKNYDCSSTKPGNWKPVLGSFLFLAYYHLMKNHATILTVYCVKAIENNDF